MSYAQRRGQNHGADGRSGPAYKTAWEQVRRRAMDGEPCFRCGAGFNWHLPANHKMAFTAHHLDALMHGYPAVPNSDRMVPAHRTCNSIDGLQQQNARRKARKQTTLRYLGRL